ncbi:EcsC family protein [Roseomonas marmotae]|uniref:EcsC family protein n=1 Tax=Roseomonas marmotae TaxID=2768161 RepID=A0ABS3KF34_9PROT|nr:EcsC family protein [Roseomonas marmotae]MBO1074961.1 EcsC family protein [Roseomonas marmotae]QTI79998.1 EcsC family protein [Roseomonas marmotae]
MTENLPAPLPLPPDAQAELDAARRVLEESSLASRLAAMAGTPIEALRRRLPSFAQGMVDTAVRKALAQALSAATRSAPGWTPPGVSTTWMHRGMAAASGAVGGAFGLPGTLVELPVSTTLLLRQIAAEAAAAGEDPTNLETGAECLKVFALGGPGEADDATETGYFATRLALAQFLPTMGASLLPGFIGAVAARFTGPLMLKLGAQAAPVVGAAAGAAVNLAFLEHFRALGRAHFAVRRLEREYGAPAVRIAWDRQRPAPPVVELKAEPA